MNLCLITTLLVSGLCSLPSYVPRQFHVVKEQKNWTDAQQYCREKFTDLATIDNMAEMEEVKSLVQEGVGNVWIGLQGKWQWSLADSDFYRENVTEFRNWAGQPIQPNGQGPPSKHKDVNCVIQWAGENGKWNDFGCSETFPFICYDGEDTTQPYVLVNEGKNWADAQRYCREKHTDLASVRNQTENDLIWAMFGGKNIWIGLFKAWEWSDGSNSSFHQWGTGEPNAKDVACTEIKEDFLWNDASCHLKNNFICYQGPLIEVKRQFVRVELQVDSQVNISDPAVHKALLQQTQQRLREKGMPAAKLTWMKQPDGKIFHGKKEKQEEGRKRMKRNEL